MFKDVELWDLPAKQLYSKTDFVCEMSTHDHEFLCGLIRYKNPKKLLEIGIAEGGTTAVITKCLSLLGNRREIYSVDLCERLYCDEEKKTGYVYEKLVPYIDRTNITHKILLGETVAKRIEKIGKEIDFVIIDTTHQFPGEILDFLCVFPYLAKEATIVLHDVDLNYVRAMSGKRSRVLDNTKSVATKLLFSTVKADKYLPVKKNELPNIAAFTISEDTYEHISDLFYLLSYTWAYVPEINILNDYRDVYKRHYSECDIELYDTVTIRNQTIFRRMELARSVQEENINKYCFPYHIIPEGSKVVLYGAGTVGNEIYKLQKSKKRYDIVKWVDKNYKNYIAKGLEVENPSNMLCTEFDYIVVAVEKEEVFQAIYHDILQNGWDAGKPIISLFSKY